MKLSESLIKALEEGKLSEKEAWDALVDRHLKPDLKMNRENHYVPVKDVLRNREISRQEDIVKSVGDEWCRANGRNDYWQERSGSGVRPVFHVGVRDNRDKERYAAALQGIAEAMKKAGFGAEIKTGSLYVTLDEKLADAIRNRHEEYLELMEKNGASLPQEGR